MGTLKAKGFTNWIDGRYIERDREKFEFGDLKVISDKENHCFFIERNLTNREFAEDAEIGFVARNEQNGKMIVGVCKEQTFETLFFESGCTEFVLDKMTILEKTNEGFDLLIFNKPGDRQPNRVFHFNNNLERTGTANSVCDNNSPTKTIKPKTQMARKNSILDSMLNAYKSQFLPEKENNINISTDGTLCVRDSNGAFIGINKDNELVEYPEGLTVQVPVFSINKKATDVKVGDIIKSKNTFSKVIEKKADGTLRCLSFSGYNQNRKQIKNVLLGAAMTRVVINLFDFSANTGNGGGNTNVQGILPFLLLKDGNLGGGDGITSLLLMQSLGGGNANMQGILPFLLLKDGNIGGGDDITNLLMMQSFCGGNTNMQGILPFLLLKDGDFGGEGLETIMAMQMLGGGTNPFGNLTNIFGGATAQATAQQPAETTTHTEG